MQKLSHSIFLVLWNITLILIAILNWWGNIHFGFGMADLLVFGMVIFVLFLVDIFFILSLTSKKPFYNKGKAIVIGCSLFLIYIVLQMTILRGPESPWNGRIFF
jgi:hypothetical protein